MPMSLVVQGRRRGGFFGGFFDTESRPIQVQSAPVTLTVLPLPAEGRPPDFAGAVGQFTFQVSASPLDVAAGDPVTVRSVIDGEGTLDGIASPAVAAGDAFRTYPPQVGLTGDDARQRTFEQVVIPLRDGAVVLPPPRFSYFDPAARAYRTIAPAPIALTVRPSAQAHSAPEIVGAKPIAPPAAERPETLARDIVFIKDAPGTLRPVGFRRYRTATFWLLQLVPVALFAAASTYARRRHRLAGDVRYARFTRAGRTVRATLARAHEALARGDLAGGHDVVAAAMRDYLAAKLDLPPGAVAEAAPARLRAAGIDGRLADDVTAFFAACEAIRFAPASASYDELSTACTRADAIVRALERTRRIAPAAALLLATAGLAAIAGAAGEGPTALFFRANGLYGTERYADAAATYEQVLAAGVESGAVHFNLGNARYKTGDVGGAVVAYERAARLMPGDPDLDANLALARERAHDVVPESLATRVAFPLAERASTDTLAVAAAAAWWLVWLLLAAAALVPRLARAARPLAVAVALAGAVAAASGAHRWWTLEHPTIAVVVAHDDATARSEPTPTATALFVAKPGTVVRVDRTREAWSQVEVRDGRRGWIETAALTTL
jgi:tetratricopeptide (TPR) repeat protein